MSYVQQGRKANNNIPGRLTCTVCKTTKGPSNFSKNQLKGSSLTLRCTTCTGGQRQELKCLKCSDVLPLARFSNSSKKAGGNQWCIQCTMYKEAALPDYEQTEAPPAAVAYQPSDGRDGTFATGGWAVDNPASSAVGGRSNMNGTRSFASLAHHESFADQMARVDAERLRDQSSTQPPLNMQEYVPPHLKLREKAPQAASGSVSPASNVYECAQSFATLSVAETEPAEDDGWNVVPPVSQRFHAWDHNGQHQMRTTSGPSPTATPAHTPQPSSAPAAGRSGGWAKPAGVRTRSGTQASTGFVAPEPKEHNNRYDNDSSDDDP